MIIETLQHDMIAAMKSGDKAKREALASLIGNIKKVAIDKGTRTDISDDLCNEVILKELKTIQEQIDSCPASRQELLSQYTFAKEVVSQYAPHMMSKEEVTAVIEQYGAAGLAAKNKGLVMKAVMPYLKGKADGQMVSQIVAEICSK